jgi:hypothetical protein
MILYVSWIGGKVLRWLVVQNSGWNLGPETGCWDLGQKTRASGRERDRRHTGAKLTRQREHEPPAAKS